MSPVPEKNIPEAPPLPIKQVIEKSVSYIIKNGTSFEEKLRQNDANGQFAFLSPEDPHNSYYKYKLEAAQQQEKEENKPLIKGGKNGQKEAEKPRELLFLTDLPPISDHDLEIIKATAIYVACNSSKHQEAFQKFMDRKGRRNQFAFINKSHTLHGLFQHYIKQYQAIIDKCHKNTENDSVKLIDSYISEDGEETFFQKAYDRAAFEKRHKIKEKNREQDERNKQLHYASIDWQEFAFVKKVNFDAVDEVSELPVPISRESVVYRALDTKTKDLEFVNTAVKPQNATTVGSENTGKNEETPVVDAVPANVPKGMKIKAAGESRLKRKANEQRPATSDNIRCPITGQLIPEKQFDMHLKTLLRDPRYKEQQENFMRKNFTYASNLTTDQVYDNIKRLVRTRGQSEEEEAAAAKRINLGT